MYSGTLANVTEGVDVKVPLGNAETHP